MIATAIDDLRAAVRANPTDWDARRVYADALEEAGEHVLANGQRWQARQRKWTRLILWPAGKPPRWGEPAEDVVFAAWCIPKLIRGPFSLPLPLMRHPAFDPYRNAYGLYLRLPDVDAAEAALAAALWDLGWIVREGMP